MVTNNKILTVSYGTFSCTLEGFDDSFGTMKAIAEYFRDLAADDRYFGAEPPQPDTEMLARIAQREIARRVDAHEESGQIVLRAADASAPLQAKAAAPVPQPASEAEDDNQIEEPAVEAETPVAAEILEPVKAQTAVPGSIADKLQRIREVVATKPTDMIAPDYSEDEHAESFLTRTATELNDVLDAEDSIEAEETEELDELDGILNRIDTGRNEVAEELVQIEDAEEAVEEEEMPAPDTAEPDSTEMAEAVLTDTTDAQNTDDSDDTLANIAAEIANNHDGAEAEISEEDLHDLAALDGLDAEDQNEASVFAEEEVFEPAAPEELQDEAAYLPEEEEIFADLEASDDSDDQDTIENILSDLEDDEDVADLPRAKVLKVKRADLEAAIEQGAIEEVSEDDPLESSLSAEDEAELMRELAEVEAEISAAGEDGDQENGDEIARLLDEADDKLDAPETASRREEMGHLRTAMAAATAEKELGEKPDEGKASEPYRADLAQVVRPRRPGSAQAHTQDRRPTAGRPAPLKLVAEQRVDEGSKGPAGPVRPRRVVAQEQPGAQAAEPAAASAPEFSDFVAQSGADSVYGLLEAAATYMGHVENREQFTRFQLMGRVRSLSDDSFSREDSLRAFGQLLREGKIEKIGNGRFRASDDLRPNTAKRAAV
ncbi:MAG: hypothetical protein AAFR45_07255 [Pseudomonadota bacterium]